MITFLDCIGLMNTTCKIDNNLSHMSVYCEHYEKTVFYFFASENIIFMCVLLN